MPWARDRQVHAGPVAAVVGGGALLARSWVIVATTDHVSELEARAFAAVNRLPGGRVARRLGADAARKPRRLARRGRGHLVGQSRPAVDAGDVDREPDRILGGQGREAGRQPRAARRRCCPTSSSVSTPADSGTCPGHSAVAFGLATALAPSLPRSARPAVYAAAATRGVRADLRRRPPAPRRGRRDRGRPARGHVLPVGVRPRWRGRPASLTRVELRSRSGCAARGAGS